MRQANSHWTDQLSLAFSLSLSISDLSFVLNCAHFSVKDRCNSGGM